MSNATESKSVSVPQAAQAGSSATESVVVNGVTFVVPTAQAVTMRDIMDKGVSAVVLPDGKTIKVDDTALVRVRFILEAVLPNASCASKETVDDWSTWHDGVLARIRINHPGFIIPDSSLFVCKHKTSHLTYGIMSYRDAISLYDTAIQCAAILAAWTPLDPRVRPVIAKKDKDGKPESDRFANAVDW